MRGSRSPSAERGFILPMTLFLLPAFAALSLSAFVLVRGQWTGVRLDVLLAEELAAAFPPPHPLPAFGEHPVELGHGYFVFRAPTGPLGDHRRGLRLGWVPDPDVLARDGLGGAGRDPRVGPIPLSRLLWEFERDGSVFGAEDGGGWDLPSGHRVEAPGGWVLLLESGEVAILAPAEVRLAGAGVLAGAILAGGDLILEGSVRFQGGVGVGGRIRPSLESTVSARADPIRNVFSHPLFSRPHLVPGGERLGRP